MNCSQALISLFLLAPCDDTAGGHRAIESAVSSPARPEADSARDKARLPGKVLHFFGVEPGMTVFEVFSGGGYYTQILDAVVGPEGKVLAHNNQAYINYIGKEYDARAAAGDLPNTELVVSEVDDLEFENGSLDAAVMVLAWHDFLFAEEAWGWPDADEKALVGKLCDAMKPGAVLGIIDHAANPGGEPGEVALGIHRIDPEVIKRDLSGTCFELADETELLRNPEDDRTTSATEGPFKGKTDRFVLKYVRQ